VNLLQVEDLHVRYGSYEAVKGVSFTLAKGEILGIVGESGSGKSTIAKTLMGLEKPSAGTISLVSDSHSNIRTSKHSNIRTSKHSNIRTSKHSNIRTFEHSNISLQMVFQDAVGSLNPRMTVRQTLSEVLWHNRTGRASRPARARMPIISSLLDQVGLSSAVLDQYPREMSGGQCQRISIARALACQPEILVADEPVSALDVSVQARILNLLRDLRKDLGLSILLIAHDLAVVKNVCDRICVMEKGRFVDVGVATDVFEHPTSDYTRRLLSAVPTL